MSLCPGDPPSVPIPRYICACAISIRPIRLWFRDSVIIIFVLVVAVAAPYWVLLPLA